MSTKALDVLHHASAIHTLVQVLGERTGPFATVLQVFAMISAAQN